MEKAAEGILLIDKEEGETSYDVVRKARKVFPRIKVGHAGTLDPFATGLLVLLLGSATKVSRFLMGEDKLYWARVKLGEEKDTLDPTGKITRVEPVPMMSRDDVEAASETLVGEVEQVPPSYSALRVQGKRAYELARKGQKVTLTPRRVKIHAIKLLAMGEDTLDMEIHCSSGTYVRSLASDLAQAMGTCGHLLALRRLRSGCLSVEQALPSRELVPENTKRIEEAVVSVRDALCTLAEMEVTGELAGKIRKGYQPQLHELKDAVDYPLEGKGLLKVVCGRDLVAIVALEQQGRDGQLALRLERVFPKHFEGYGQTI